MVVYFDTSALVKLYIEEADSARFSDLWNRASVAVSSDLLYAEMASAFARKAREQNDSPAALQNAERQFFDVEWAGFHRISMNDEVLLLAREFLKRHPLRASDAIHLASMMRLRNLVPDDAVIVACADGALETAAHAEGFATGT